MAHQNAVQTDAERSAEINPGVSVVDQLTFVDGIFFDDAELLDIQELREKYGFTTGPRISFYI